MQCGAGIRSVARGRSGFLDHVRRDRVRSSPSRCGQARSSRSTDGSTPVSSISLFATCRRRARTSRAACSWTMSSSWSRALRRAPRRSMPRTSMSTMAMSSGVSTPPHFRARRPLPLTIASSDWAVDHLLRNGGCGYLSRRHVGTYLDRGELHAVPEAPCVQASHLSGRSAPDRVSVAMVRIGNPGDRPPGAVPRTRLVSSTGFSDNAAPPQRSAFHATPRRTICGGPPRLANHEPSRMSAKAVSPPDPSRSCSNPTPSSAATAGLMYVIKEARDGPA